MLTRIDPSDLGTPDDEHWTRIARHPLIQAVARGAQRGTVYADPSRVIVLILTKSGFSLISVLDADPPSTVAPELFSFLRSAADAPRYLHFYSAPSIVETYLQAHVASHWRRRRAQFRRYTVEPMSAYEALLPPGYWIATVQDVGIHRLEEAFQLDFGHRYWDSPEAFFTEAIGACIVSEAGPVAVCYSACIVDGITEMDTLVLPAYRGRRFMRIVSEPFFNLAASRGLIPHWDTFIENRPSYELAQKFGLVRVHEYDLISVSLS